MTAILEYCAISQTKSFEQCLRIYELNLNVDGKKKRHFGTFLLFYVQFHVQLLGLSKYSLVVFLSHFQSKESVHVGNFSRKTL